MKNQFLIQRRTELAGRQAAQDSFNIMTFGNYGTGKSTLLSTCRQPVYICSFDPGGTKLRVLQKMAEEGKAILDTEYEYEDVQHPKSFKALLDNLEKMEKADAFDALGTIAIDSLTTMSEAVMNEILRQRKRPNTTPQIQDYGDLWSMTKDLVYKLCALPCDFVLTGHISTERDEVDGKIYTSLMTLGKSCQKLPIIFDEVIITDVTKVDKSGNATHVVRCKADGKYRTSTRMFGGSDFQLFEEPDIMKLRQKAGKPCEHLAPIE